MLQSYEIARKAKWLAVLNFLLAAFIIYTMNSIVVYYFNKEIVTTSESPYVVRIIANSNRHEDILQKEQVAKVVEQSMSQDLYEAPVEEVAIKLNEAISKNYPQATKEISYGQHVIPPKLLNNRLYPQQKQTAIVIKLGSGRGDNWFCAVFPQTCEPEQDADDTDEEKQERKWLLKKVWRLFYKDETE